MKKLLVSTFALFAILATSASQSFAACGCGCNTMSTPCAADAWAFPSNYAPAPQMTPCCAAPCATGCASSCEPTCGCQTNCGCNNNSCCKRTFWDKLFHRNKCCGCN